MPTDLRVLRRCGRQLGAVVLGASLVGCTQGSLALGGGSDGGDASSEEETVAPLRISTNLDGSRSVPVDHDLSVRADQGTITKVKVTSGAGRLPGRMRSGTWHDRGRLEPGTDYTVTVVGERSDGSRQRRRETFHTEDLTLEDQTYASVAPLEGETVGVGMPVIVKFDLPVEKKAVFERHMEVTSTPSQRGSWHWLSDHVVRWRPAKYWEPGTQVHVDLDVNSLPAGSGIYGQENRSVDFTIGDSVVSKINVDTHQMDVFVNGSLARSMPISAGKPGWETRSGTKVVIEKFEEKRMDAATIGVDKDDPEYYNLAEVPYALRVTFSGEFIHGAPWSVGSQGSANVSHGCVGMSVADAQWLYDITKRGDVVEVTGSDRWMSLENGYGDWNLSFADYREGSALS